MRHNLQGGQTMMSVQRSFNTLVDTKKMVMPITAGMHGLAAGYSTGGSEMSLDREFQSRVFLKK